MNLRTRKLAAPLAAAAIAFAFTSPAHATSGVWNTGLGPGSGTGANSANPWIASPADGSKYAEWNVFNDQNGNTSLTIVDSIPDIGSFGLGAGAATLTETSGGAFVTGGGNIYSFAVPTTFTLSLPGAAAGTFDVWLRIASLGTLPTTTASLNGIAATHVETYTESLGGMGGDEKEWYWKWTVSSAPALSFAFSATGSSMSLDQLAVYASPVPVPEPSTYAMLGLGLAAMALARGRRRRS